MRETYRVHHAPDHGGHRQRHVILHSNNWSDAGCCYMWTNNCRTFILERINHLMSMGKVFQVKHQVVEKCRLKLQLSHIWYILVEDKNGNLYRLRLCRLSNLLCVCVQVFSQNSSSRWNLATQLWLKRICECFFIVLLYNFCDIIDTFYGTIYDLLNAWMCVDMLDLGFWNTVVNIVPSSRLA